MRSAFVLTIWAASAAAAAVTSSWNLEPLETLRHVPTGWQHIGIPRASQMVHLRIAVAQANPQLLDQAILDVSDPSSVNYGKHLKRDELKALLRPSPSATESIVSWLTSSGVSAADIEDDGEWINFHAPVSVAEQALGATFGIYQNRVNHATRIRTLAYSVPQELSHYISMVQPTTRFGQIKPQRSHIHVVEDSFKVAAAAAAAPAFNVTACNATITPDCLKDIYNVKGYHPKKGHGDFLGFNNFLEEYPRFADLARFESEYAPYAVGKNFTYTLINGGLLNQSYTGDSVEANLDVQYALTLAYPIDIHAYSTGGRGPLVPDLDQPTLPGSNEPYLDFLNYILKLPDAKLPRTLTTSYGEDEQSVPLEYNKQVCSLFGQLGARGVSVLFSSGDTGVGSACLSNDGKNTTRFLPIFPAACPYVTSVGGTYHIEPERAISFSSGGFSDRFPRPAYQEAAVSAYLKQLGNKWKGLYNPAGRGFPDVAAQAYRFHVVNQGQEILVGGTSAASPTFAGIVALLNNARAAAGKPGLGFLNPFIYSVGYKALNDITVGGSTGCTGTDIYSGLKTPVVPFASWNATEGWDPVTGKCPLLGVTLRALLIEASRLRDPGF